MVTGTRAAKKWLRPYAWDLEKPAQNPEEPNSLGAAAEERVKKTKGVAQTIERACPSRRLVTRVRYQWEVMEAGSWKWAPGSGRIWVLPEQRLCLLLHERPGSWLPVPRCSTATREEYGRPWDLLRLGLRDPSK